MTQPSETPEARRTRARATSRIVALRFQQDGDQGAVREGFLAAAAIDPTDPQPHYNLALLAEQRGRMDEAITHFEECLARNPGAELEVRTLTALERLRARGAPPAGPPPLVLNTPLAMPRPRTGIFDPATLGAGPRTAALPAPVPEPPPPPPASHDPETTLAIPGQKPAAPAPHESRDLVGSRLGGFLLEKRLAEGRAGDVYLGRQGDRVAAVKVVARHVAASPGFRERFDQEMKAASLVHDPHVVAVVDYGHDGENPFVAMEHVEGEDLQRKLQRLGRLAPREAVGIAVGIAKALAAAHRAGVLHHDLKPSNVIVDAQGSVKVLDFGLARAATGPEGRAGLFVSPGHVSPEQARGEPADRRADLYALGVILFQTLAGQLPWKSATPIGLVLKHVLEPPPALHEVQPSVPRYLSELVAVLLRKVPTARYADAVVLAADLEDFLAHEAHYSQGGERLGGAWPAAPAAPPRPKKAGSGARTVAFALLLAAVAAVAFAIGRWTV